MAGSLIFVIVSYVFMLAAFYVPKWRKFHMPVMVSNVAIDIGIPFYLIFTQNWYRRLIEQEEIFSFMIWMHFILVLTLYALYMLQVFTVKRVLNGEEQARKEHRSNGLGILIARGLVILSAAMLIEPGEPE